MFRAWIAGVGSPDHCSLKPERRLAAELWTTCSGRPTRSPIRTESDVDWPGLRVSLGLGVTEIAVTVCKHWNDLNYCQ